MAWILAALFGFLWITCGFLWINARGRRILAEQKLKQTEQTANRANELASAAQKRADDQFHVIEDIEKERDDVWKLYRQSSIGAGTAQAWLFEELEKLTQYHNQLARVHNFKPFELSSRIRKVVAQFRVEHVEEQGALAGKQALAEKRELAARPAIRDHSA